MPVSHAYLLLLYGGKILVMVILVHIIFIFKGATSRHIFLFGPVTCSSFHKRLHVLIFNYCGIWIWLPSANETTLKNMGNSNESNSCSQKPQKVKWNKNDDVCCMAYGVCACLFHNNTVSLSCRKYQFSTYWPRTHVSISMLRQNSRHCADDIFKCPFLNRNIWTSLKFSLKFVPRFGSTIFQHWFR